MWHKCARDDQKKKKKASYHANANLWCPGKQEQVSLTWIIQRWQLLTSVSCITTFWLDKPDQRIKEPVVCSLGSILKANLTCTPQNCCNCISQTHSDTVRWTKRVLWKSFKSTLNPHQELQIRSFYQIVKTTLGLILTASLCRWDQDPWITPD